MINPPYRRRRRPPTQHASFLPARPSTTRRPPYPACTPPNKDDGAKTKPPTLTPPVLFVSPTFCLYRVVLSLLLIGLTLYLVCFFLYKSLFSFLAFCKSLCYNTLSMEYLSMVHGMIKYIIFPPKHDTLTIMIASSFINLNALICF